MKVGIVAPSSLFPKVELEIGLTRLRQAGFEPRAHAHLGKRHLQHAGTDEERASAFYEMAMDPAVPVLWCVRGGYGATHLLPILDHLTRAKGTPPRKLLVGFSDITALHEFVRSRWSWSTLHAPMLAWSQLGLMEKKSWDELVAWVKGIPVDLIWKNMKLTFLGPKPALPVIGEVVGGNLAVLCSLLGTPFAPNFKGRVLFLEDVSENSGQIGRMFHQLLQSGSFSGIRAIILGEFVSCEDLPSRGLKLKPCSIPELKKALKNISGSGGKLIRPKIPLERYLRELLAPLSKELRIPVAIGFPAGHGDINHPIPLGAQIRLDSSGKLELLDWSWWHHAPRR